MQHVDDKQREFIEKMVNKRTQMGMDFEKKYGSDWYALMQEATAIKDQQEENDRKAQLQDSKEYREASQRVKKELRGRFYDGQSDTKAERLHKLMEELAAKRKSN